MPVGFCCSKCVLYDEAHTCLKTKSKYEILNEDGKAEDVEQFHPISTTIEDGLLKVVISKKDREIPIVIDIQKQLESK
ncbi:MAG: hypothetical protein ACTSV5_03840 [Promethearchaeota archaeon]